MATKIRSSNLGQSATTTITNIVVDNSLDSSGVIALVDSDYVQARANEAYIKGIADSAYVDTVIAGASITDLSDADQTVRTTDDVSFGTVTLTGTLDGPSTFYIDPAPVDSDAGLLVIRGDLQVDGTTTTVNSETVTINDKNIVLADSASNASEADGAGITVEGASATITYDATADAWDFNKDVDVTGTVTADGITSTQDINITESIPQLVLNDTDGTNVKGTIAQAGTNLFLRSRGGTSTYGGFQFARNNGSDVKALEIHNTGDIRFYEDDGSTQGFRWDASAGRLGIGITSTPATLLHLTETGTSASNSDTFRIDTTAGGGFAVGLQDQTQANPVWWLRTFGGESIAIGQAYNEYVRFDGANERVGIGDTTPSQKLDVNGNVRVDGAIYVADRIYHDGDTNTHIRFDSNDNISLNTSGGARLAVQSNGDVVFYENTGASRQFRWDADRKSVRIGAADSQMDYRAPLEINGLASDTNDREPVLAARSKVGASIMQLNVRGARWEIGSGGSLDTTPSVIINANSSFELLNNGNNSNGNIKLGSNSNNSTKYMAIRGQQYASDTETEGYGIIGGVATSSDNRVRIGGGLSEENAATQIEFITAGSTTTRGGSERMRLHSNGLLNVGTSPSTSYSSYSAVIRRDDATTLPSTGISNEAPLAVINNNTTQFSYSNIVLRSGTGDCGIGAVYQGASNNSDLFLYTDGGSNGIERMRITHEGRVGIGTTSPTAQLDVRSDDDPTDGVLLFIRNNTSNGNGAFLRFDVNNVGDWSIGVPDNQNKFRIAKDNGNSGTAYMTFDDAGRVERNTGTGTRREVTGFGSKALSTTAAEIFSIDMVNDHLGVYYELISFGGDWGSHSSARWSMRGFINGSDTYNGHHVIENEQPYGTALTRSVTWTGSTNNRTASFKLSLPTGTVTSQFYIRLLGYIEDYTIG